MSSISLDMIQNEALIQAITGSIELKKNPLKFTEEYKNLSFVDLYKVVLSVIKKTITTYFPNFIIEDYFDKLQELYSLVSLDLKDIEVFEKINDLTDAIDPYEEDYFIVDHYQECKKLRLRKYIAVIRTDYGIDESPFCQGDLYNLNIFFQELTTQIENFFFDAHGLKDLYTVYFKYQNVDQNSNVLLFFSIREQI